MVKRVRTPTKWLELAKRDVAQIPKCSDEIMGAILLQDRELTVCHRLTAISVSNYGYSIRLSSGVECVAQVENGRYTNESKSVKLCMNASTLSSTAFAF